MARRERALVEIDPTEWMRLADELRAFQPALLTGLRRSMKVIGNRSVDAVRAELAKATPGGNDDNPQLADIADHTKTVVSFSRTGAGVRISSSSSGLVAAHKPLLNVYNRKSTEIEGRTQPGQPYFGSKIYDTASDPKGIEEIREALQHAVEAIGATGQV